MKSTYVAVLRHSEDDAVWYAHLQDDERVHTYGRTVKVALEHLRDAVALWFDVDADSFELLPDPVVPKRARSAVARARARRRELEHVTARANAETRDAVRRLSDAGLSRRDVAELIGISHQRVQQLLDA